MRTLAVWSKNTKRTLTQKDLQDIWDCYLAAKMVNQLWNEHQSEYNNTHLISTLESI